jgi:hypothetical protein
MFLRRMPHLCHKMRRLTSKDAAARKKNEEDPAPNFYALSRENPLPAYIDPTTTTIAMEPIQSQQQQQGGDHFDLEALLADRRRTSGLANLFAGAGAGFGANLLMNQQGALQESLQKLQNLQNVNMNGRFYGNLMPTPLMNGGGPMQQLKQLNAGAQCPDMAQLFSMNNAAMNNVAMMGHGQLLGGGPLNF